MSSFSTDLVLFTKTGKLINIYGFQTVGIILGSYSKNDQGNAVDGHSTIRPIITIRRHQVSLQPQHS